MAEETNEAFVTQMVQEAIEWVRSPEGQARIAAGHANAERMSRELAEAQKVTMADLWHLSISERMASKECETAREALAAAEREAAEEKSLGEKWCALSAEHALALEAMQSERDEAVKRAEAAGGERDAWKESALQWEKAAVQSDDCMGKFADDLEWTAKQRDTLATQVATLRGAAEPFARIADYYAYSSDPNTVIVSIGTDDEHWSFTVQDARNIRAAIASLSPAPEAEAGGQSDG